MWILHELDILPKRPSRPYNLQKLIIIPQEVEEKLTDPRFIESMSISSEIDHINNQEHEISTSLSDLNQMLRQLESEDVPLPNTEEETNAWTLIDSMGTIANDFNLKKGGTP